MASVVDRMLEKVTSDLSGLGSSGIVPGGQYTSLFFQAAAAMIKAYQTAELTEEDKKRINELKTELKTAAAEQVKEEQAAELQTAAELQDLAKTAKTAELMQKTAELMQTAADKTAELRRRYADKTAAAAAELQNLNDKKTAAAVQAVKELLSIRSSSVNKTRAKVIQSNWYVNGLLKTDKHSGSFLFRPEDRAVFWYPSGEDVGKLPYMRVDKNSWRYVGQYVDHKNTNSLTGLVRWAYAFTKAAAAAATPLACLEKTNAQAADKYTETDCGGVVFAFPVGQAAELLPCDRGKPDSDKPLSSFPVAWLKKTAAELATAQAAADKKRQTAADKKK